MSVNIQDSSLKISIVIPVKNGAQTIANCLDGIKKQTLYEQCEIIVIDSGSTDSTLDILKNYQIRLYQIPPKEFSHGATRNYGVSLAKGEYVVMTVQDAVPANEFWLENMVRHFKDEEVAGVCGQQIVPHDPDKNPHQWFRPQSEPSIREVQFKNAGTFKALSPKEQRAHCLWDDVTAMYRKSILEQITFQPVMFGEDMLWAKEALTKGYKLVYDTSARVEHYHHHSPEYTYRRTLIVWFYIYKNFGFISEYPFSIKNYLLVIYRNSKWDLNLKWVWHNWSIMYNYRRAVKEIHLAVKNNTLDKVEQKVMVKVPQGIK